MSRPLANEHAFGREAHFQVRVARDRHAASQQLVEPANQCGMFGSVLAGPDQLDFMISFAQTINEATQGDRHAIDFWWVSLRYDGKAQGLSACRQLFDAYGIHGLLAQEYEGSQGNASQCSPVPVTAMRQSDYIFV